LSTEITVIQSIEPVTRSFLEKINSLKGPQLYEMSINDAREALSSVQADGPRMPADVENVAIPGGPTGEVSLRIVRPAGNAGTLPATLFFHGGGWALGDKNTHDRLVRRIANLTGSAVVFVNFTRSPEARYPVAIEESYFATKYMSEHGGRFDIDQSRISVAGDSVGGNMATVVTMMAKQRGGPDIRMQALFYPVTDANFDTPSYRQFATGHWLTREAMKWFWELYLPDRAARKQPMASPLLASAEQLKGLPPALVINGEFDVLRDEGEAYAHKLNDAGVRVTALRVLGTIHDFVMLNALSETPAAVGAVDLACDMLKRSFV
jgi:acetyl esterase